ncbi:MAG: prepilin-type N-terminal cleavage/methylation domain-containing protein [Thermoguttaceae bacterium]|jgi:prepilin-type N-terminal cleavage/methylation domain-containing protein
MIVAKRNRRSGFTLIEVLIVVVVMAILAGAIIPQLTSSTNDARKSSVKFNLQAMRTQIQVYSTQHNNSFPAFATFLNQMTLPSDINGNTTGTNLPYGPYIQGGALPINPYNNSGAVVAVATPGTVPTTIVAGGAGWQYDQSNGGFYANNAEAYVAGF